MSYSDDDIIIFINSYNENLLKGVVLDRQIPNYVMYLKTLKHYRENNITPDPFFKKRLNIGIDDDDKINKLINRIKKGKALYHRQINTNINPSNGNSNSKIYSGFNEGDQYENKFELLNSLSGAMDNYYKKVNKRQEKLNKNKINNRSFDTTEQEADRHYKSYPKEIIQTRHLQEEPINTINFQMQQQSINNDPFQRNHPLTFNYRKNSSFSDINSMDPIADRKFLDAVLINTPGTQGNYIKDDRLGNIHERFIGDNSRMNYKNKFIR